MSQRTQHLGLKPRPIPDPEVLAIIGIAADQLWPRPTLNTDQAQPHFHQLQWRFSSRWWNKPTPVRRARPWTNH